MLHRRFISALWIGSCLLWLLLAAANVWMADLNQDEGWYLYAAREVSHGHVPYRDFAFTQGPVMPYVYAAFWPLYSWAGVAGGRVFTALLGLAGAGVAALLAWQIGGAGKGRAAAVAAFMLAAVNVYHSFFTTTIKTYSLCGLFLAAGAFAMCRSSAAVSRGRMWAALSGLFLVLAAGTRISAAAALAASLAFYILLRDRKLLVAHAAAAAVGGAVVFLPFLAAAPDGFIFDMLRYHSGRDIGGISKQLVFKCGFVSRVVQGYFVPIMLVITAAVYRLAAGRSEHDEKRAGAGRGPAVPALWGAVGAVTLVHLAAPFPYDDYQVAVFPVFAALAAYHVVGLIREERVVMWAMACIFLASAAASVSSPINHAWVIRAQDRIWVRTREKFPIQKLKDAAAIVKKLAGDDRRILTQDTYLAVEAGLDVPRGLEMGPFSYFPGMSDEDARRRRLLNRNLLRQMLQTADAPVAAFSGYGLAIGAPAIEELPESEREELRRIVRQRYEAWDEIEHFGQNLTTLVVFKLKAGMAGGEVKASGETAGGSK